MAVSDRNVIAAPPGVPGAQIAREPAPDALRAAPAPRPQPGITLELARVNTLKDSFHRINREKVRRVRDALSPPQRDFLDILPLLFHTNYPLLPGFVSRSTPFGVAEYTPQSNALNAARRVARSFEFKKRAARSVDILGISLMGSSGTVAYSRRSDFDIWLCHRPDLEANALEELTRKAGAISRWAASLGLEAHFFTIDAEKFRAGHAGPLSSENSGSTQHDLLLDEFYRTGLLLAGRFPIWWLVPPELESRYTEVVAYLRDKRFVSHQEFVDFGTAHDLSPSEFVGAALWQLTKAIASPHKSLLKIMLLEAYASEYPKPDLLSSRYKQAVYAGVRSLNDLDPYVLFSRKVEDHLALSGDAVRLELARECFYLKVNVPLSRLSRSRASDDWRTELVREIVEQWNWKEEKIARLDNRARWKIDRVMEERNAVVRALTHAYKLITRFAREHGRPSRVSERDLTILGRKLFAAYEHKAGKIEIVNYGQDHDLSEEQVAFSRDLGADGSEVWRLKRTGPNPELTPEPLQQAPHVTELLAWCHFNRVVGEQTRIAVQSGSGELSTRDLQAAHAHLKAQFPVSYVAPPDISDLVHSPRILAAGTFVNIGVDPMASYTRQGRRLTSSRMDALSYGGLHENLVHEIDYLFVTTWREAMVLRHHGLPGLLECLCEHLGWVDRANEGTELERVRKVACHCVTPGYARVITQRVARLFEDVTSWYRRTAADPARLYILKAEEQFYVLRGEGSAVSSDYVGPYRELLRYLGRPRSISTTVNIDPFALPGSPLELVYRHSTIGAVDCYYLPHEGSADLFVVDEHGALFSERIVFYSDTTLVRNLRLFFESVQYRQTFGANDATLAGDPTEGETAPAVHFNRLSRRPNRSFETTPVQGHSRLDTRAGFHVQVIGKQVDGQTQFTLYCDEREFDTLEHGENVFEALAEHILRRRSTHERYPIFITDIDLSQLEKSSMPGRRLQTIHYLHYKKRIEDRLNEILSAER